MSSRISTSLMAASPTINQGDNFLKKGLTLTFKKVNFEHLLNKYSYNNIYLYAKTRISKFSH